MRGRIVAIPWVSEIPTEFNQCIGIVLSGAPAENQRIFGAASFLRSPYPAKRDRTYRCRDSKIRLDFLSLRGCVRSSGDLLLSIREPKGHVKLKWLLFLYR